VLLSADGVGTMAIQRQTGNVKPNIRRWQARFMAEGGRGQPSRRAADLGGAWPQAASGAHFKAVTTRSLRPRIRMSSASMSITRTRAGASVDEKSQIQALDRTQPGLPMKRGRCGTR